MSEIDLSNPPPENRPPDVAPAVSEPPKMEVPEAVAPPESNTKGILRDAIQKVMEEIEFHEREAKRHAQLAQALRKDLRESVSFMLGQKEGTALGEKLSKDRAATAAEPVLSAPPRSSGAEKRTRPGRKRAGKRGRA